MSNSNHADKRSVSTDALETLGTIIGPGFWDHYETVTGEKVSPDKRDNFFSCSC